MRKNLLARKEKAPRKVKFLAEIDRLICWTDLASLAEPCIEEAEDASVTKASLEALVRIAVLDRCFGFKREELLKMEPANSAAQCSETGQSAPSQEDIESFFQIIARCKSRGHIMQELDRQLARVGISRGRTLSIV
jgi:hypothetical protein